MWLGVNNRGYKRTDFTTNFATVEAPLNEGGIWQRGLQEGLRWTDPKVTANGCVATSAPTPNRYDDDIAHLKTSFRVFTPNQFAQGVVYRAGGYVGGGGNHEIELFLRMTISANVASGIEISLGIAPLGLVYAFVVRWEGAEGSFTTLIDPANSIGSYTNAPTYPADGDVWRGEMIGSTINAYQNGTLILTTTDSTFSQGQPGLGFWPVDGATPDNFGWKSFRAGDL